MNKTIADAVALGIPITHTKGSMIVNIGAQSTEISVIEGGKVVLSKIVELGGKQLNEAIVNEVRKQYNLHIGNRTARRLKFSLAYLKEDIREARKVVGIDSLSGLPREGIIPSDMIYATICRSFKIAKKSSFPGTDASADDAQHYRPGNLPGRRNHQNTGYGLVYQPGNRAESPAVQLL